MVKEMNIVCHWFGGHIWLSLVGSEVDAGEKVGKLAVMDRVLIVLGRLLQGFWVGFLGYLLLRLWGWGSHLALVHLYNQSNKVKMSLRS